MLGFLYKDIITNKTNLLILLLVLIFMNGMVFMLFVGDNPEATISGMGVLFKIMIFSFSAFSFFISGAMSSNYFKTDERKKWGYYVVSTPRGAVKQIVSKYVLVLIVASVTYVIPLIVNIIVRKAFPEYDIPNVSGVILIFLFIMLFLRAIETPFIVGLGQKAGEKVKAAIMIGFFLFALIYMMFADISWMGSSDQVIEKIFEMINKIRFTDFINTWGGRLVLMSIPLYMLSCFISIKVYNYGIERIEK